MSIKKSIAKYPTKWDEAIADAKKKIAALEASIRLFRDRKKAREPWPGENGYTVTQEAGTESVPA